jgi:hypothetical protein
MSVEVDGFQFDAATAQQPWRSGFYVSRSAPADIDFFIVLDAAQLGWSVTYDPTGAYPTPLGWSVNGGVLDATQYHDGNNLPVHFCNVGVDGCYIWLQRRWRPVAADGNRVYVIEELMYDADLDGDQDVTNQRTNFYDATPAPPFRAVQPPAKAKATKGKR